MKFFCYFSEILSLAAPFIFQTLVDKLLVNRGLSMPDVATSGMELARQAPA